MFASEAPETIILDFSTLKFWTFNWKDFFDRIPKNWKIVPHIEKDINKFLQAGDKVLVKGEGLGSVEVEIVE